MVEVLTQTVCSRAGPIRPIHKREWMSVEGWKKGEGG